MFGAMETDDGDADAFDFGIDFALGAATVGLGYTSFDDDADSDLLGIGIELGMGENALIAAHAEDSSTDGMTYQLAGQFAAGANTFRVGFAKNDESGEDASTLGFAHEFGEDISMAVEFESSNEADVIGLGLFIAF